MKAKIANYMSKYRVKELKKVINITMRA